MIWHKHYEDILTPYYQHHPVTVTFNDQMMLNKATLEMFSAVSKDTFFPGIELTQMLLSIQFTSNKIMEILHKDKSKPSSLEIDGNIFRRTMNDAIRVQTATLHQLATDQLGPWKLLSEDFNVDDFDIDKIGIAHFVENDFTTRFDKSEAVVAAVQMAFERDVKQARKEKNKITAYYGQELFF